MRLFITLCMILTAMACRADLLPRQLELIERADSAISAEAYAVAEQALVEALNLSPAHPANAKLMTNLASVRHTLGRDSLALQTINAALSLEPSSLTALNVRAAMLADFGRLAEARADCSTMLDIDSTATAPRLMSGMLALQSADFEGAEADFRRLQQLSPEAVSTHSALAMLHSATGRTAEAERDYTAALAIEPRADLYAERALCRLLLDNLPDAADDIARGLALDPDEPNLYLYRALLNRLRYREADAKADTRRALSLGASPARTRALHLTP